MSRPQKCQHRKADGSQCGSPAMRNKRLCYFHHASRLQHPNCIGRPAILPEMPILEDAYSLQLACNQTVQALLYHVIDAPTFGAMASLLRLAAANLPNVERELREAAESRES